MTSDDYHIFLTSLTRTPTPNRAVLEMLEKLREKVGANSRVLEGNMDAIMSALRPSQQAQFLVWIEKNQTCMMMLNSLWGQLEDQQSAARAAAAAARGSTAGGVNGVPVISRSTAMFAILQLVCLF